MLIVDVFQIADENPPSEGDDSDVASVDTDEGDIGAVNETDNDDDDDEEFVDAGVADRAPWVTERRHSGDGEVSVSALHISIWDLARAVERLIFLQCELC